MSAQQIVCYCHKDIMIDYMFRLYCSHHQVYTGEHKKQYRIYTYIRDLITFTNIWCNKADKNRVEIYKSTSMRERKQ